MFVYYYKVEVNVLYLQYTKQCLFIYYKVAVNVLYLKYTKQCLFIYYKVEVNVLHLKYTISNVCLFFLWLKSMFYASYISLYFPTVAIHQTYQYSITRRRRGENVDPE